MQLCILSLHIFKSQFLCPIFPDDTITSEKRNSLTMPVESCCKIIELFCACDAVGVVKINTIVILMTRKLRLCKEGDIQLNRHKPLTHWHRLMFSVGGP